MIEKNIPEKMLFDFLVDYSMHLRSEVVKFMRQDIEHSECGLAYDALVFEIQHGHFVPDDKALGRVIQIAFSMNISYPNLSTG